MSNLSCCWNRLPRAKKCRNWSSRLAMRRWNPVPLVRWCLSFFFMFWKHFGNPSRRYWRFTITDERGHNSEWEVWCLLLRALDERVIRNLLQKISDCPKLSTFLYVPLNNSSLFTIIRFIFKWIILYVSQ